MGSSKTLKRATVLSPTSAPSCYPADHAEPVPSTPVRDQPQKLGAIPALPGKLILFTLCLVAAVFQFHFAPQLWSFSPSLFPQVPLPPQALANPAPEHAALDRPALEPEDSWVQKGEREDQGLRTHRRALVIEPRGLDLPLPPFDDKGDTHQSSRSVLWASETQRKDLAPVHEPKPAPTSVSSGAGVAASEAREEAGASAAHRDRFTPYVTFHEIDVARTRACRGVLPRELLGNVNREPIMDLKALGEAGRRALVFMPRHGLGNSLRGYVSAFVYVHLSGRTMVRFHGAEHTKVYDTLCMAFDCGFDSIHWDNATSPVALYRALEALNPSPLHKSSNGVRRSISEDVPVMVSRSPSHFDGFWNNMPRIQACVYSAFSCSSVWCTHSRALHALLRGPTPALEEAIGAILRKFVPGKGGQADKEIAVVDETDEHGVRRPTKGLVTMFDVALHMRTRAAAIESLDGRDAELSRVGCTEKSEEEAPHQFLKQCLWGCIERILRKLDRKRRKHWESKRETGVGVPSLARLSILLTTDSEALRPTFVKKLSALGDVYYSTGGVVHLSKSSSSDAERLPTMAEFFLMAKSHTIIEAGSYVSTFAYFAGLFGNGTLASIDWNRRGGCGLKLAHRGELRRDDTAFPLGHS